MRIRRSRRLLALVVTVAAVLCAATGEAQSGPVVRVNVLGTTVGGVFGFFPALPTLVQNAQTGGLCSPGSCYTGSVVARGNRGWQLQVRLGSNPAGFTVNYVATTVPPGAQAVNSGVITALNTTTWLTVAQSATAASGSTIGLQFNARRTSDKNGFVPTGAQLAAVVAYRVIAYP